MSMRSLPWTMARGCWLLFAPILCARTFAAADTASGIPFKAPAADAGPSLAQWSWAVLVCGLALGLALWWLRRRGSWPTATAGSARPLQVLQREPLGPGSQLLVVRYGQRQLLLLQGPQGASCIKDEPYEPASGGGP